MELITTKTPIDDAALLVTERLRQHLARGERVVWLLSGGSSMRIAVRVAELLGEVDVSKLAVTLTDERYGPVGHADENWQQLTEAGFSLDGALLYRPLHGRSIEATTSEFAAWLEHQLSHADYTVGVFGIGADGHTAGIKPDSVAVDSTSWAAYFQGDDFQRITMTCAAIRNVNEAVVQVSGPEKAGIIHEVMQVSRPLNAQPAQILKAVPVVSIFSDQS